MRAALLASVLFLVAGCASHGPAALEADRLRDELMRVEYDQRVATNAPDELDEARSAIGRAASARGADQEHYTYVADRLIAIAAAEGLARHAQRRAEALSTERELLLIDARTREARADRAADAARLAEEEAEEVEPDEAE